jgi:hypothetical protein
LVLALVRLPRLPDFGGAMALEMTLEAKPAVFLREETLSAPA